MSSAPNKYLRSLKITFVLILACLMIPKLPGISDLFIKRERKKQREKVLQQVQTAGGWDALQAACVTLIQVNQNKPLGWWYRWKGDPTSLPPAIAALQPMEIKLYQAPQSAINEDGRLSIVQIKIFGTHSIVGFSKPYYGLEIITDPGQVDYRPQPEITPSGNSHKDYREVTNQIYEIY